MVEAAGWYRRQASRLARRLGGDPRWQTWIAVSPDAAGASSRFWPSHLPRWPQGGGDLGDRMGRAFKAFPPGPLLIVGGDIPGIERRHVAAAFRALGSAEAVFGPAPDGGYWLVGLNRGRRRAPPAFLKQVRWSSPHTLADSVASLGAYSHMLVETLQDVDEVDDLPAQDRARFAP